MYNLVILMPMANNAIYMEGFRSWQFKMKWNGNKIQW